MKNTFRTITKLAAAMVLLLVLCCEEPFDPASLIQKRRFLAIVADPLEAAPGEAARFRAVVTNAGGTLYEGPILWSVVGGDGLRLQGEIEAESYVELPASEPFVWTVPSQAEMTQQYGPAQKSGWLLTIGASAFTSGNLFVGQLIGEPIPAFKLFAVSNRDPADRMENPVIEWLEVTGESGTELLPDTDGAFETTESKVIFRAVPDTNSDRFSFHWFATEENFESGGGSRESLRPDGKGFYRIYCVLRKTYFFEHDDDRRTRITGIDWATAEVRFN